MMNSKVCGKKKLWPNVMSCSGICMERLEKIKRNAQSILQVLPETKLE
jgi:hypothetical protein